MNEEEVRKHFSDYPIAFPMQISTDSGKTLTISGMMLRDYFAGQAIVGIISSLDILSIAEKAAKYHGRTKILEEIKNMVTSSAKDAYDIADAMLKEREK